ncbi:MAG: hypothetical protein JWM62_943 [Frankiales bacterium]|nr:hypothetical protein [Frankiales bacterium]
MRTLLVYLLLAVTPAAAFSAARAGLERWIRGPRTADVGVPAERSLERLVADLRRLELDHVRTARSDAPGRASRLRAIGLAYDETLHECCRAVGLTASSRPPLSAVGRLETEAALAAAGVTW